MTDDIDTDKPASEQLDLGDGPDTTLTPARIVDLATDLEQAENASVDAYDDDLLARYVGALKRLENAVEDARKDVYEAELDTRVDEGERVLDLTKTRGSRTYVTDDAEAFDAVLNAGHDPREVSSVKASKLKDVLGKDAEEHLGTSEYHYFRRQS